MEHKDNPELEQSPLIQDPLPVSADAEPAGFPEPAPAQAHDSGEQPEFVDYFADILPDQPVSQESAEFSPPVSDDEILPPPDGEPEIILEIQSAVESILSDSGSPEEAVPAPEVPAEDTEESPFSGDAPEEPQPEDPFANNEDFEALSDATKEETPPAHPRPVRKGRPKRKREEFFFGIPQIAVTCVWLAIILLTGVTLGRMLWVCAADVLAFGREDKLVTITVYESDTIEDVTDKLHRAGLIRYPGLFGLYASLAVDEGEIQPGIWDLNTLYDYHALVSMMSPSSSREVVENVLIPEGYSCRQIFELLETNRVCTAKDLADYAASGELRDYWFLEGLERGSEYCLEGFLFPDTYDFYKNSSPRDVLEKMLDNFDYRFTEEMRLQMDALNANVTGGTFDIHDVVIVASLIEKETANNEESPKIASVIYNRLFRWGNTPAYLNIDAAIVYALDGKTDLTADDLKIDSPYNTYTHIGLTPGAISNPGLASLQAALNPAQTNYYFYVLNPAMGEHKFSETLEEHNAFIATLE